VSRRVSGVHYVEVIREYRPDVVHSWGWMSSLTAGAICRARSIPFIDGLSDKASARPDEDCPRHRAALRRSHHRQ